MRIFIDEATRLNGMAAMQKDDGLFTGFADGAFAAYRRAAACNASTIDDIVAKLEAASELMDESEVTESLIRSAINDLRRFV